MLQKSVVLIFSFLLLSSIFVVAIPFFSGSSWDDYLSGYLISPPSKEASKEICGDRKDNDFNGKVDCQDPECENRLICRLNPVILRRPLSPHLRVQWEQLGLQGFGLISSVSLSQQNPNHLVFGTEYAGAFQSFDGGTTWKRIIGLPSQTVTHIAIDPNDDHTLYAFVAKGQLWRSQNQGLSWQLMYTSPSATIAPRAGGADFALSSQGIFLRMRENIVVSPDKGVTWINPSISGKGAPYHFVKMKNNGKGLIALRPRDSTVETLYKTNDGGRTWSPLFTANDYPNYQIQGYDFTDAGDTILIFLSKYSLSPGSRSFVGVSTDSGNTWAFTPKYYPEEVQDISLEDSNNLKSVMAFSKYRGLSRVYLSDKPTEDLFSMFPSPTKPSSIVYDVLTMKLVTNTPNAFPASRVVPLDLRNGHLLQVPAQEGGFTYWLPTDQGLFHFDANTQKLTNKIKGLALGPHLRVTATSCGYVYAGLWDESGGIRLTPAKEIEHLKSTDIETYGFFPGKNNGCVTPVVSVHPSPYVTSYFDYYPDGRVVNITFEKKIDSYKMRPLWEHNSGPFVLYKDGKWYFLLYEDNPQGVDKVLMTLDENMEHREDLFSFSLRETYPYAFFFDSRNQLWVLAEDGLWMRKREQWTRVLSWSPAIKPAVDHGHVVMVAWPHILIGTKSGLFISQDGGTTWKEEFDHHRIEDLLLVEKCNRIYASLHPALGEEPITDVLAQPFYGIWESSDFGRTWSRTGFPNKLEKVNTAGLSYDPWKNRLLVGTLGEGFWAGNLQNSC